MKVLAWFKQHPLATILLTAVLILAAFLRFYRIGEYMTFLGDEGRDALVIKDILINHHLPLLGPPTSVGNIYSGPLYYYMMALSMAIFWLNPIAAAGMNALIGVMTVGLIYYLAQEWFGQRGALIASFLYAISPVTIIYSKSSWNPNPLPFFTLLAIIGVYLSYKYKNAGWLILSGMSLAFAIQMHYLALILLPILAVFWLVLAKFKLRHFSGGTIVSVASFLILMSPIAIFDFRHHFMNLKAFEALFTQKNGSVGLGALSSIARIPTIFQHNLIGRLVAGDSNLVALVLTVLILGLIGYAALNYRKFKPNQQEGLFIIAVWGGVGLLFFSLYKGPVFDHYLNALNPLPFLLLAGLISLWERFKFSLVITVFLLVVLSYLNLAKSPLLISPQRQLQRTQGIANFIIDRSGNRPFNFALIAEHNYDAAYQFYLDLYGHKPLQLPFGVADQLFVVCEDQKCQPVGHPKYEIAAFGWSQIDQEYDINGVRVFKLSHYLPKLK